MALRVSGVSAGGQLGRHLHHAFCAHGVVRKGTFAPSALGLDFTELRMPDLEISKGGVEVGLATGKMSWEALLQGAEALTSCISHQQRQG